MRKVIIAGALVVALIAASAVALPVAENYFAGNIKAQLDRDGFISAGAVEVGLLDRRITLHDVRSRQLNGITAARWEASGLAWPVDELLHGRTPLSGLRLGDPIRAQKIEADGLHVTTLDGQDWTFGKVLLEGVDLERFDADLAPTALQVSVLGARLLRAASVHRFEERDVIHTIAFTGNTVGFKSLTVNDLDHGRLGAFDLASLEATGKASTEPSFRMLSFKGEGLDLRPVLAAMSQPSWRPGMPIGRIRLDRGSASGFGGEVFTRYGISLGSITTSTTHDSETISRSATKIDGFVLAPPANGIEGLQMRLGMQAMGLKELRLGLECAGGEDRTKGELTIERCTLSGPDLGDLTLSARVTGADAVFWQAFDSGNFLTFYGTKAAFAEATLSLADKGLLDHGLRGLAMMSAKAPAAARAGLAEEIRRFQPANVLITDDLTKLLETVARFVEKGGTLTLEAKPDPPLALNKMSTLVRPGPDLVGLLGLTATLSK